MSAGKRSHHGGTKVHATQLWRALKNPLGRKMKWQSAARMAYNWMVGKPIMRRPVALKVLYKLNEELINRLQADAALEMASKHLQMPIGTHVIIQDDGQVSAQYDYDHPGLDWTDESTWPENLAFPEGAQATSFAGSGVQSEGFQMTLHEIESDFNQGLTTIAQAMDHLRQTGLDWIESARKVVQKENSYHGAYLNHRLEHIAFNVTSNMIVKLFPYIIPGKYRARQYGRVQTIRKEFYRNYFYWGQGPGYNGHPCIHLPPGRPAWSDAQYIFKKRMARWLRRKNPKDKRCKPFYKIKVKVPRLRGRFTAKLGRPPIGRRYRFKIGRKLAEQIAWSVEHPLKMKLEQTEAIFRASVTRTAFMRGIKTRGGNYYTLGQDVLNLYKTEMIHDVANDICKNIRRVSRNRFNLYKRKAINAIGDPVIDYGVKVAAKVIRFVDPHLKYTPVFDSHGNKFDKLLFQADENSFPTDMPDELRNRF